MPRSEPRPPGADAPASGARTAELLRRIAEQSRDLIAVLDAEYRLLGFNQSYHDEFAATLGVAPRIGADIRVALATLATRPEERTRALTLWERALAGEEFTVVAPLAGRDPSRLYEFTFRPLLDEAGEVEGAFHVVRDVTEREEAREEVERLNRDLERRIEERTAELERRRQAAELERQRLQAVLDILPVGVWLSDAQGRILDGNRAGRAIWGDARLSRIPSEYGEDFRGWWPDGRRVESHEWGLARALERGEVSTAEEIQIEATDGQRKTILNYALPIRDEEDRIVGGVAVNVDITARKAEERRQELLAAVGSVLSSPLETEGRLRKVVEIAADRVADLVVVDLADGDGRWRRVDVGTADPGLAEAAERLRLDGAPGPVWPGSRRAVESGEALLVTDADRPSGDAADAEPGAPGWARDIGARSVLVAPLRAEGRVTGALTLVSVRPSRRYGPAELETVTELADRVALALENVRLYDELRRAVQARDEVVALVSHDLRNPVHAIQMAASLIGEEGIDPEKKEGQRRVIQRAASRMERLIADLLNITRIEAGTFRVDPTPLDPVELVDEALEMARPFAEPKGVALEREGPATMSAVPADRDRVLQVLSNLIHNAVSFTPEGGKVRLGMEVAGDRARFTVSDSGPGVAPEERDRVFERFWQGRRGTGGGAGLGLCIAKGIVEAHGGSIRLVTDGERKPDDLSGAIFLFELPLSVPPARD